MRPDSVFNPNRLVGLVMTAVLVLSACGGDGEPTPASTTRVTDASVTGTVTGVDPSSLPEGSQVAIRVFDASVESTTSAAVVGQQEIITVGQGSIPFDVGYLEADIKPQHAYVARADVTVDGTLRYITTQEIAVITQGAPASGIVIPVELVS